MRKSIIQRSSTSPQQTESFGVQLAESLPVRAGLPVIIYLTGDLGAGKTTFAKGFVRGCGIADAVRSPTYALFEPYEGKNITVVHLDLYRLSDPAELEALGLRDWARPQTVWLIEWPAKGGAKLPLPDVEIALRVRAEAHELTLTPISPLGAAWLSALNTA